MAVLVQKYGGSSVADVDKIGKVADRVVAAKREGHDVVVVVSAMGKTTDELVALARRAAESFATGGRDCAPPRRELDMLVSTGERVTMALLSIAISSRGEDAISFTGSQSGILTNDRHFDARIIEVRPHRIEDELARGRIVIVAGYQGMSYKREITTLGRGGSDTTAVALAAALGAERCEIYSDVDGVYSGDPRVIADPVHWPTIDLGVLAEMAEAGARVLNAQAVEWARRNKIAIVARRTSDPIGAGARETIAAALPEMAGDGRRVRAIVGMDPAVIVQVARERYDDLCAAIAEAELPVFESTEGIGPHAHAVLPLSSVPDWRARAPSLARVGATFDEDLAIVSLVGAGLGAATIREVRGALRAASVEPAGTSVHPLRVSVRVPRASLTTAQRALHAAFVDARAEG